MKLKLATVLAATMLLTGCNLTTQKSGIEIMSNPAAKVFINGKEAGMTPYKNNTLKPGEVEIRLEVNTQEWIKRVHLENGANTVISRELENNGGGYVLFFEATGNTNKAGLLLSSSPDRATVSIDDEVKGFSPLRLEDVGEGDKKLSISFPGYKSTSSFVKLINGYQLVVDADLPLEEADPLTVAEPTTPNSPFSEAGVSMATIKETETGWLRVRSQGNGGGAEVAKVHPGERYRILEESGDWLKIDLTGGKTGWVSAKYAEKTLAGN